LFVVRRIGTARLDKLDTLVSTHSTCRTCRVVSRRDVTSQVEFGLMFGCRDGADEHRWKISPQSSEREQDHIRRSATRTVHTGIAQCTR